MEYLRCPHCGSEKIKIFADVRISCKYTEKGLVADDADENNNLTELLYGNLLDEDFGATCMNCYKKFNLVADRKDNLFLEEIPKGEVGNIDKKYELLRGNM